MCSRSAPASRSRKPSTPPRVDRLADHAQQARAGVDRDRAPGVDRRLRDDHRERGLAGAAAAGEPEAAAGVEVRPDRARRSGGSRAPASGSGARCRSRRSARRRSRGSAWGSAPRAPARAIAAIRSGRQRHRARSASPRPRRSRCPSQRPNSQRGPRLATSLSMPSRIGRSAAGSFGEDASLRQRVVSSRRGRAALSGPAARR